MRTSAARYFDPVENAIDGDMTPSDVLYILRQLDIRASGSAMVRIDRDARDYLVDCVQQRCGKPGE